MSQDVSTTVAETVAVPELLDVDPALLKIGKNVRVNTRLDAKEFAASIKARGVLEVITTCRDEDGELVVLRGQRRAVVATQVGTPTGTVRVQVLPVPDDGDRIVDQLSENLHRSAMSEAETRDGIEQLNLLGVSASQITKRTALPRRTVDASLIVTASPGSRGRMDSTGLTLDQAALFAEFADDPQAVTELEQAMAWGRSLEHFAQRLRDDRAERIALQSEVDRLRAEDVPVLDPHDVPDRWHDLRLDSLVNAEGQSVPAERWPQVPGAAVVVHSDWEWPEPANADGEAEEGKATLVYVQVWICTEPQAAGLCSRWVTRLGSAPTHDPDQVESEAAAKSAERRTVVENNKAWRSAETVRREWLAQFLNRRTVPAGSEALICQAVLTAPHWLEKSMQQRHPLLCSTFGTPHPETYYAGAEECADLAAAATTPKAAIIRALSAVLMAWEHASDVHVWRRREIWNAQIMAALIGWGYEASDIERSLLPTNESESAA